MTNINSRGCDRPSERDLNNHVIPEVADKWREIGVELLDADSTKVLDIIESDHQNDTKACCTKMFKKWLDSQEHASWEQMLTALRSRSVQLNTFANKIGNMLIGNDKKQPSTMPSTSQRTLYGSTLTFGGETIKFSASSCEDLGFLDTGVYGTAIFKMRHTPTQQMMAVKKFAVRRLNRDKITELGLSQSCPYIVDFYGYIVTERDMWICMELMDINMEHISNNVYKVLNQTIPEEIIGKVLVAVANALHYLKNDRNFINGAADIHPSDILLNKNGDIKCDLDLLLHRIENKYVGSPPTQRANAYVPPERIESTLNIAQRDNYAKDDVWNFGIIVVELALGEFPYKNGNSILGQLVAIITNDSPKLSRDKFSRELCDFVDSCLIKDPTMRPGYEQLLTSEFVVKHTKLKYDVAEWYKQVMQKLNPVN